MLKGFVQHDFQRNRASYSSEPFAVSLSNHEPKALPQAWGRLKWVALACALTGCLWSVKAAVACDTQDPDCESNIAAAVAQATTLNAAGRHTEAADLMERLLMEQPDALGAEQQYRVALAGIDGLDAPPAEIMPSTDTPWKLQGSLQVRGGYGSNLNQAPSQPVVQLTLPTQIVTLELQPQFQKQAGGAMETQLNLSAERRVFERWQWQVRSELFNRETAYTGYADYQGGNLFTSWMRDNASGSQTGGGFGVNLMRYGGDVYLYTAQLMLRHVGAGDYCRPQIGVDGLWQRLHNAPIFDSRYGGLMTGLMCATPFGLYQATLSAGWDWASDQRPGGDQLRGILDLMAIWPTDAAIQNSFLKLRASVLQSNDSDSYSPLLNRGEKRYLTRATLGLDYDWPLGLIGENWRGVASFKWQNQDSNIGLFQTDALEGWLGVSLNW